MGFHRYIERERERERERDPRLSATSLVCVKEKLFGCSEKGICAETFHRVLLCPVTWRSHLAFLSSDSFFLPRNAGCLPCHFSFEMDTGTNTPNGFCIPIYDTPSSSSSSLLLLLLMMMMLLVLFSYPPLRFVYFKRQVENDYCFGGMTKRIYQKHRR